MWNFRAGLSAVLLLSTAAWAGYTSRALHGASRNEDREVRVAREQSLPRLAGERLKATLVEVTYAPGASSPAHSHPCPVIGYVLSGELRTQVKGGAEAKYRAGETFYEPPDGVHLVSANASSTAPAKLLAIFVCDHEAELSTPVNSKSEKGNR